VGFHHDECLLYQHAETAGAPAVIRFVSLRLCNGVGKV